MNIRFIVAVVLVVAAFAICLGGGWMTKNIASQLLCTATLVVSSAEPTQADAAAELLVSQWNDKKQVLSLFLAKSLYEELGNMIVQIYSAVKQNDNHTIESVSMQLSQQLLDIMEQETFSLYNLF